MKPPFFKGVMIRPERIVEGSVLPTSELRPIMPKVAAPKPTDKSGK